MATYAPAKRATAFIFYASVISQANTKIMQVNPTIAAGDFKVSIDGGALANLATIPAVTPAASAMVKFSLSGAEMTGDNITIVCSDAAGAEWCDTVFNIQTAARQFDDLAYPATSGRSSAIDASGRQLADVDTIKTNPVVNGGTITFPTTATLASTTNITAGTMTTTTNLTTNNDKTGYGLSSAAVQAIWDALTSALTTVGSIGKLIVDNLNATISSRMATYTQPTGFLAATFPGGTIANTTNITAGTITTVTTVTNQLTAAQVATGVWTDTTAGDFTTALSVGKSVMNGVALGTGLTINAYTGNTAQTGDSFARIGVAGAGLTNIDLPNQTMDIVGNITGNLSGSVGSVTGAVGSVTGAVGSVTGAVGSVTGNVGGNVTGSIGSVAAAGIAAASLATAAKQDIADFVLDRNMATGTDSGTDSTAVRTPRQALRGGRNKATIAAGVLTVTKEDDVTASWTAAVTTAAGNPLTGVDPT